MSLLERIVIAHRCHSTHHYIAIEALQRLEDSAWRDALLINHDDLLRGVSAPADLFKDVTNHVLHVGEGDWGGAQDAAVEWYAEAVTHLRAKKWHKAAYALGVLSYYYGAPLQPFNTDQSEEKSAIYQAMLRSVYASHDEIFERIADTGYPDVSVGNGRSFVAAMVADGARRAHPHYQTLIDHYNFELGAADPQSGLDKTLVDIHADLIAYSMAGFAKLIERAVAEAGVAAPKVPLSLAGYAKAMAVPVLWFVRKQKVARQRRLVAKMFAEYQKTGKVLKALPASEKALRRLHTQQILRMPIKELDTQELGPIGAKCARQMVAEAEPIKVAAPKKTKKQRKAAKAEAELDAAQYDKLDPEIEAELLAEIEADLQVERQQEANALVAADDDAHDDEDGPLINAPDWSPSRLQGDALMTDALLIEGSIADQFSELGIETVEDLMISDADALVSIIGDDDLTARMVTDWQDQASLMMTVGGLRAFDAQVLVGAGIRTSKHLAAASAKDILNAAQNFLSTPDGNMIAQDEDTDIEESDAQSWIDLAQDSAS